VGTHELFAVGFGDGQQDLLPEPDAAVRAAQPGAEC
jgi:hypothetical protein